MVVTQTTKKTEEKPKLSYSEAFAQEQIRSGHYFYGPGSYQIGDKVVEYVPGEKPGPGYVRVGNKWVKATEVKIQRLPPAKTYRPKPQPQKSEPEEEPMEKSEEIKEVTEEPTLKEQAQQTRKDIPIKKDVPSVEYYYGLGVQEKGPWKGEFTTTEELKRRGEYYTERPFVPVEGPIGAVSSGFVSTFVPSFEVPLYEEVPAGELVSRGYKFKPTTEPYPTRKVGAVKIGKSEEMMTGTEKEYYKVGEALGTAAGIALLAGRPIEPVDYELVGAETSYLGAAAKVEKGTKAEIGAWTKLKYAEYKWGEPTGFIKYEVVPSYAKLTSKPITKKTIKTVGEISFKPEGKGILETEITGYSTKTPFGAPTIKFTGEEVKVGSEFGRLYHDISKTSTTAKELEEGTRMFYEGASFSLVEGPKGSFDVGWGRIKKIGKSGIEKEIKVKSAGVIRKTELPESVGDVFGRSIKTKTTTEPAIKVDTSLITKSVVERAPLEIEGSSLKIPFVSGGTKVKTSPQVSTLSFPKIEVKDKSKEKKAKKTKVVSVFEPAKKVTSKKRVITSPISASQFKSKKKVKSAVTPQVKTLFKQKQKQEPKTSLISKLTKITKVKREEKAIMPSKTPLGFEGFGFGFGFAPILPKIKLPNKKEGFKLFKRKKSEKKKIKKSYAPDIFSVFVGRKKKGKPKKKIYTGFEFRPIYLFNTKKR